MNNQERAESSEALSSPTKGTDPVVVGNDVYVPSVMQSNKIFHFSMNEVKFLDALLETHDIAEAAKSIGKDEQWGQTFIRRPGTRDFFEEKAREEAVYRGATPKWIAHQLYEVWTGTRIVSREQMEAIKALGDRVWPKVERVSHSFSEDEFEFVPKKA